MPENPVSRTVHGVGANPAQKRGERHHVPSRGGETDGNHEQGGRENGQGATGDHMYNFSEARPEYKLATKGP